MSSIRRTPSQLHSLQQIPTQHNILPQHLGYKNELNHEYVITLARNDENPWWWSEKIETCRSGFKCFKWKLYRCICWLIVEVTLRNARCNGEIHVMKKFETTLHLSSWQTPHIRQTRVVELRHGSTHSSSKDGIWRGSHRLTPELDVPHPAHIKDLITEGFEPG